MAHHQANCNCNRFDFSPGWQRTPFNPSFRYKARDIWCWSPNLMQSNPVGENAAAAAAAVATKCILGPTIFHSMYWLCWLLWECRTNVERLCPGSPVSCKWVIKSFYMAAGWLCLLAATNWIVFQGPRVPWRMHLLLCNNAKIKFPGKLSICSERKIKIYGSRVAKPENCQDLGKPNANLSCAIIA